MTKVNRGFCKKELISEQHYRTKNGSHKPHVTTFWYCQDCGRRVTASKSIKQRRCGLCAESSLTPSSNNTRR